MYINVFKYTNMHVSVLFIMPGVIVSVKSLYYLLIMIIYLLSVGWLYSVEKEHW